MELIRKLWARISDVRTPEEVKENKLIRAVQLAELDLIAAKAHVAIAQKKFAQRGLELKALWQRQVK